MTITMNTTKIKVNAQLVPAFGLMLGVDKMKYPQKTVRTYMSVLLCFMVEVEVITPKNVL